MIMFYLQKNYKSDHLIIFQSIFFRELLELKSKLISVELELDVLIYGLSKKALGLYDICDK